MPPPFTAIVATLSVPSTPCPVAHPRHSPRFIGGADFTSLQLQIFASLILLSHRSACCSHLGY